VLFTILLAAGVVVLLLLIVLGLIVIAVGDREARRDVVLMTAIGGLLLLLLLCCVGVTAGLAWVFFGTTVVSPPSPTRPAPLPLTLPATVSLIPENATIARGESISVTIRLTNATDLYGVEVHLTHGDGLNARGLVPGTCADAFIAQARVADERIDFAAARMPPQISFTGDCDVASFTLTGEVTGTHAIAFDSVLLADGNGNPLPVTTEDGVVTVMTPAP